MATLDAQATVAGEAAAIVPAAGAAGLGVAGAPAGPGGAVPGAVGSGAAGLGAPAVAGPGVAAAPAIGSPAWIASYTLSSRTACRKAQLDLARVEERVFSLEGDLGQYSVPFHRDFPERFLQIGIAEADLVGTAVGLARRGKIPFVNSFASFLS